MSESKPPIIRPPSDWELAESTDVRDELPRRSGVAVAALVLAICGLVVTGISAIPMLAPASPAIALLGPLAALLGIAALICGIVGLCTTGKKSGRTGRGLAMTATIVSLFACVGGGYFVRAMGLAAAEARSRAISSNNMKQIGLALHNHHDTYAQFPPAGDANYVQENGFGRRHSRNLRLSWRVYVLPFSEQSNLYDRLNLDEPWDSAHNSQLFEAADVQLWQSPSYDGDPFNTVYLGVVRADREDSGSSRPGTALDRTRGLQLRDISDGTANTIIVVEADADQAVPWPKPGDWEYDPKNPRRGLGSLRPHGFVALFADGSVRCIPNTTDGTTLQRLFERNDGEIVEIPMTGPRR